MWRVELQLVCFQARRWKIYLSWSTFLYVQCFVKYVGKKYMYVFPDKKHAPCRNFASRRWLHLMVVVVVLLSGFMGTFFVNIFLYDISFRNALLYLPFLHIYFFNPVGIHDQRDHNYNEEFLFCSVYSLNGAHSYSLVELGLAFLLNLQIQVTQSQWL